MSPSSNDELVRQIKEHRREQIQACSERAAQKIFSRLSKGKPSVEVLRDIISGEFTELQ